MASINLLHRLTRDISQLIIRLLYRGEGVDCIFASKVRITISRDNWFVIKYGKRLKDAVLKNIKFDIDNSCAKLEQYILDKFNKTNLAVINKGWLKDVLLECYNPKQKEMPPETVLDYFPIFINRKVSRTSQRTVVRYGTVYNVCKGFVNVKKKESFDSKY
jgi:hypothetical protein